MQGSFQFDHDYVNGFLDESLQYLKKPELEKLLSVAQSLASSQELRESMKFSAQSGDERTYQQKHGYSHLSKDYARSIFRDKSENVLDFRHPLLQLDNSAITEAYTNAATGAPGAQSRTAEPRGIAVEDILALAEAQKPRPPVKLSYSPVMAMPISSVGDGYYRGNSMGDARVMNWRKTPPKKRVKLKPALKSSLEEVNEGTEADQWTPRSSRSAMKLPSSRKVYPQYIYNRQGLPVQVHALYEE